MKSVLVLATLLVVAIPAPASAHDGPHRRHDSRAASWAAQADSPGDFRCDAYRDRGRTDCDAAWRDQRRWTSRGTTAHRADVWRSSGLAGAEIWRGAWGRPDLVHAGGVSYDGRDPDRINWCRATYRSYDPHSGYYRTYDGRERFCG